MIAPKPPALRPGDFVECIQGFDGNLELYEYFDFLPQVGDAFRVREVLIDADSGAQELLLEYIRCQTSEDRDRGFPRCHFRLLETEEAAESGRYRFRMRMQSARLSQFVCGLNAGRSLKELPPNVQSWWINRY